MIQVKSLNFGAPTFEREPKRRELQAIGSKVDVKTFKLQAIYFKVGAKSITFQAICCNIRVNCFKVGVKNIEG